MASMPGHATVPRSDATEVRLHYERAELASHAGARRLLQRIGDAALEACGASSFSLTEVKSATIASQCWKDAVAAAVRRIDSPLLTAEARKGRS
jgi:UrcA family protein